MAIWTWRKGTFSPQENGGGSRLLTLQPPARPEPWEAGSQAVHPGTVLGLSGVPSSVRSGSWPPDPGCPFQTRKPEAPAALRIRAFLEHCAPGGLWDLNWCARRPPGFAAQRARTGRAEIAHHPEAAAQHLLSPTEGSSRCSPAPPVGARALCVPRGLAGCLGQALADSGSQRLLWARVKVRVEGLRAMDRGLLSSRDRDVKATSVRLKHRSSLIDSPYPMCLVATFAICGAPF